MSDTGVRQNRFRALLAGLAIVALVVAAYARVWHAGFIWDDDAHLTKNVCIVGPAGFKEIWTTAEATYYPLVLSTFWLLNKIAGLNPLPFHGLNVLLHSLGAILLFLVLRELDVRGAWIGAALWALHPVMVQSVAWITEMKNTQSAVFYLLAILFFLKSDRERRGWKLALSAAFAAMAITSKTSTVVLPAVLALCVWYRHGRIRTLDFARLLPFVALAAAASAWTIWEQRFHSGAVGAEWAQSFAERAIIAGRDVWFYIGKLAWPHPLIFIYPRWQIDARQALQYAWLLSIIVALVILYARRNRELRPVAFAGAYFLIALLPILGFFDVFFFRYSFVSDHFQYLASMGPLALAGAGLDFLMRKQRALGATATCGLLAICAFLTFAQTARYIDSDTLWKTTLQQNPRCWMAHYELARGLRERGQLDDAAAEYERGLAIWPDYADAHYNLAGIRLERGNTDAALAEYRTAVRLQPNDAELRNNLGNVLLQTGSRTEAIREFETALRLAPNQPVAHINLADALLQTGETDGALAHYRAAIDAGPVPAKVHANLGGVLLRKGDAASATAEFQKALAIDADDRASLTNLSWLLATGGDVSAMDRKQAVALAERANSLSNGRDPFALHSLAAAYASDGRYADAIDAAQRALDLATAARNFRLRDALTRELASYRSNAPYRRPAR